MIAVNAGPDQGGTPYQKLLFTGEAFGGTPPYTWTWKFQDTFGGPILLTKTGQSIQHGFSSAKNYILTLTVRDSTGQTGTDQLNVAISTLVTNVPAVALANQSFWLMVKTSPYLFGSTIVRCKVPAIAPAVLLASQTVHVMLPGFSLNINDAGAARSGTCLALYVNHPDGQQIIQYLLDDDTQLTPGDDVTIGSIWTPEWCYLFLNGVEQARFQKGPYEHPDGRLLSQITEADYFGGSPPNSCVPVNVHESVTHAVVSQLAWTHQQMTAVDKWIKKCTKDNFYLV